MPRIIAERADAIEPLAAVFRDYGYDGASLSLIAKATGMGKGSLYHFFPNGKAEMASAVLERIDSWFETNIFIPLRVDAAPAQAISAMLGLLLEYFESGRQICFVGLLALTNTRDDFSAAVTGYFTRWLAALSNAFCRQGLPIVEAEMRAEEMLESIQGAIVFARAMDDPAVFGRAVKRLRERLEAD